MAGNTHPRISSTLFYSFVWSCTAISICFMTMRLGIRWKLFSRLFWDDACVVFATLSLLAVSIAWSVHGDGLFIAYDIATGRLSPTPDRVDKMLTSVRIQLSALCLFFAGIWAIKLAFLIFFRRIGARLQGYKIWWWWTTLVLVLVTFVISIGLLPYRCMAGSAEFIIGHCTGQSKVDYYYAVFYVNAGFDIITDLCLISMPVLFLWNVQIPLKQKLGLIGLFSLTFCVMAVAVVRVAVNGKQNGTLQDTAWIAFWAVIEIAMAIVVASLGSFRQLFTKAGGSGRSTSENSKQTTIRSLKERFASASSGWRPGHSKSSSHMALMRGDTAYSHDYTDQASEMRSIEMKSVEAKTAEVEVKRTEVPLKRASQAHIAHYSAAPTERKYMVVHPGETVQQGTSAPKNGFI